MSGIYIPGMEMPTCCDFCIFDNGINCMVYPPSEDMVYDIADGIPDWCPLVPVPEHGRLIDADALMAYFEKIADIEWNKKAAPISWSYAFEDVMDDIEKAPTIIQADKEETE